MRSRAAVVVRHYARPRESVIEALERASRGGVPIVARLRDASSERVSLSDALRALQEGRVRDFAVVLGGREVPL